MFAFSRMSDFPKVLDWSRGPVSSLFCVCQLSQRLVTWLVSWSFTVTGAKKPSTTVTKRWARVPTSSRWSGLHCPSPHSKLPSLALLMSLYLFHACFLLLLKKESRCWFVFSVSGGTMYKYRDTWIILPCVPLQINRLKVSLSIINSIQNC